DPDLAQDGDRSVAHDLVFLVGQRQGGGDGDGIACVYAHWIDILDGTDDYGIIGPVAHDFHLELFPPQQRFIYEDLRHRRRFQPRAAEMFIFLAVVGDATTCATKGEGGADDGRQADFLQRVQCLYDTGI